MPATEETPVEDVEEVTEGKPIKNSYPIPN